MADGVACLVEDVDEDQQPLKEAVDNASTNQEEYEFIEQPSEEFFCPVTFELLLSPHQTTCCGHHLSEKAVQRLQREGKPCPMCKETKLVTMPDKFFKRKASAVLIRCPNKSRGWGRWAGPTSTRAVAPDERGNASVATFSRLSMSKIDTRESAVGILYLAPTNVYGACGCKGWYVCRKESTNHPSL